MKEVNQTKQFKRVYKDVDAVIKAIGAAIPADWTPQMVGAVLNLYMQMYE